MFAEREATSNRHIVMKRRRFCANGAPPARWRRNRGSLGAVLLALSVVVPGACAGPGMLAPRSDLERTWTEALVILPAEAGRSIQVRRMKSILAGSLRHPTSNDADRDRRPFPTVLYLHGCTGLGEAGRDFMAWLAGQGYAVVGPDSLARRYRPLQCDPKTRSGGYNLFVYEFRLAEVAYAVERLKALPWVDRDNLVLIGASEGGVAAALYRGDDFSARVILQWTCHGGPLIRGIAGPADIPVLAVVRANDPWYAPDRAPGQRGDCGAYFGGRGSSRSVVIKNGDGHDVVGAPQARAAIAEFLKTIRPR